LSFDRRGELVGHATPPMGERGPSPARAVASLLSMLTEHSDGGQSDNGGAAMSGSWRFDICEECIYAGRGRVLRSGPRPQLSPGMCSGLEAALGRLLLPLGSAAYQPTGFAIVLPSALTIVSGSRWRGSCVGAILKWPSVHALNALFDRYGGKKQ